MASYLITGCSRGLGLELTKQLLDSPPSVVGAVFATARSPSASGQLEETLKASGGRGHFVQLDVLDQKSIAAAADAVSRIVGAGGLDVIINNAGIQILETNGASGMHALEDSFNTNVLAVHHTLQAFLPLLRQGKAKKIVNISSTLGSIGMKEYSRLAPFPSYKVSKAALNMLTVQYSMELQAHGFTCFTLSPGWLQTDLGGPGADLPPSVGAKGVLDIIFKSTSEDNGAFKNIHVPGNDTYDGKNPPW